MNQDWIEWYWEFIGYPVSTLTGWAVDVIPYPISDLILIFNLIATTHFLLWVLENYNFLRFFARSPILGYWRKFSKSLGNFSPYVGVLGVCLGLIQLGSQGISQYDFVPTKFRVSPSHQSTLLLGALNPYDSLELDQDLKQSHQRWLEFWDRRGAQAYDALEPDSLLKPLNAIADKALRYLDYPPGRSVKAIKDLSGLSLILGISFGGPAYHDVISSEIVIVHPDDYALSKFWRTKAILHEIFHAKGFTDEMQTEQLTWLAFHLSNEKFHQVMADYMFLNKAPIGFSSPRFLIGEFAKLRVRRHHQLLNQPIVYWTREIMSGLNIQINTQQYGGDAGFEEIYESDPWFDFVKIHRNNKNESR